MNHRKRSLSLKPTPKPPQGPTQGPTPGPPSASSVAESLGPPSASSVAHNPELALGVPGELNPELALGVPGELNPELALGVPGDLNPELALGVPGELNPELALGVPGDLRESGDSGDQKGWYRRFLPHRDEPGTIQFITYRLADSTPSVLLEQLEAEIKDVPPERRGSERRRRIEALLDKGHGSGILRDPRAAECVIENWRHFAGQRYDLIAWVVMPTHVHVMIRSMEGESLPRIVQSWKSYTGRRLIALFPQACADGKFWAREYWDRFIRDEAHFHAAIAYIQMNPVKAGLVTASSDWPYGSPPPSSPGLPNASSVAENPELALGGPGKQTT